MNRQVVRIRMTSRKTEATDRPNGSVAETCLASQGFRDTSTSIGLEVGQFMMTEGSSGGETDLASKR